MFVTLASAAVDELRSSRMPPDTECARIWQDSRFRQEEKPGCQIASHSLPAFKCSEILLTLCLLEHQQTLCSL